MGESRSVYVTLAFAGVALMVALLIGVVVLRRRSGRFPSHQVGAERRRLPGP
jgi:amyloid beta A4 protein